MRISVRLGVVCLLAVLSFGCGGGSPSSIASRFYRHLDAGNTERALTLIATSVVETFGREKVLLGLQHGVEEIDAKKGIESLEPKDEKIEGEKARVQMRVSYRNGKTEEETMSLIKENGAWKLTLSK